MDGDTSLIKISQEAPDLILIDLGLPDLDGQMVVGLMRQQPTLAKTPVIAFTAWPPDTAREMAKAYGCDGVITKPFDIFTFLKTINSYFPAAKPAPNHQGVSFGYSTLCHAH